MTRPVYTVIYTNGRAAASAIDRPVGMGAIAHEDGTTICS